ncbi:hypothetical protein LQK93_02868 [Terrabacter sp. BE26]
MFVDADDFLPAGSLGPFYRFAIEFDADISVGDFVMKRTAGDDNVVANINADRVLLDGMDRHILQRMCLASIGFGGAKNVGLLGAPWAKIYKREFLLKGFPDGNLFRPGIARSQDVLFNVEAFGSVQSVAYYQSPVYVYVLDPSSYSHRPNDSFISNIELLVKALSSYIDQMGGDHLLPALHRMCVTLFDEGVLRYGMQASPGRIREFAKVPEFAAGIKHSRMRDYSWAGRLKLATLKLRLYRVYALLLTLREQRSA